MAQKNKASGYISNVDKATAEYYLVSTKWTKTLPREPKPLNFYHLSGGQKNGELLFVKVGTEVAAFALYEHLKKITFEQLNDLYYQSSHLWTSSKAIR